MNTIYELYSKRTKYRNLRENVSNAINVFSRNNSVSDSIATVEGLLSNCYLVNENVCKNNLLRDVRESVEADLRNLDKCLSSINTKINSLNKEIEKKEIEGSIS